MTQLTKDALFAIIQSAKTPVSKRELARAFGIKGGENRVALKQILKALEKEGMIVKQPGGDYSAPDGLPAVTIVEVTQIDIDGDVFARPLDWNESLKGPAPKIEIVPDKKSFKDIREGSKALARLARKGDIYEAHIIRLVDGGSRYDGGKVIGIVRFQKKGAVLMPTHRNAKHDFDITQSDLNGAKDGDLAETEVLPSQGSLRKRVKITNIIGQQDDPRAISLISMHESGLSETFPQRVIDDTKGMKVPELGNREDLRDIPLVTIDGADARDFDDAVYARKHESGFHLIVAIADVAHYVRHGTHLDKEAQHRGNSTYYPDRVVPMLPEALSNDLCSLRPNEPRASLAVHIWIDANGHMQKYKFVRALIRSAHRLTYERVQQVWNAKEENNEIWPIITPLYEAYDLLRKARENRGALDLDLPERQILIDNKGNMTGVKTRDRYDSHKLIEEFMILANVAAASALEKKKELPCVYRIHDKPSFEKLEAAREFIQSFELSLPKGQVTQPKQINYLLHQAAKLPYSHLISQVILRCQSQAVYSTANIGHFGLALEKYAHFTSPIRRYADLLVHRALIRAYGLGNGGLDDHETARIDEICEHISGTERTSMESERRAVDRFTANYLSSHIGATFSGKISGVTRFGLFVTLDETGADGLVPMKSLGDDFYVHDEKAHCLVGRRRGFIYRLGAPVRVVIAEADGITGSSVFNLAEGTRGADLEGVSMPAPRIPFDPRDKGGNKGKNRGKPHIKRGGKSQNSGKKGRRP